MYEIRSEISELANRVRWTRAPLTIVVIVDLRADCKPFFNQQKRSERKKIKNLFFFLSFFHSSVASFALIFMRKSKKDTIFISLGPSPSPKAKKKLQRIDVTAGTEAETIWRMRWNSEELRWRFANSWEFHLKPTIIILKSEDAPAWSSRSLATAVIYDKKPYGQQITTALQPWRR